MIQCGIDYLARILWTNMKIPACLPFKHDAFFLTLSLYKTLGNVTFLSFYSTLYTLQYILCGFCQN
jgi:hypothetical protein